MIATLLLAALSVTAPALPANVKAPPVRVYKRVVVDHEILRVFFGEERLSNITEDPLSPDHLSMAATGDAFFASILLAFPPPTPAPSSGPSEIVRVLISTDAAWIGSWVDSVTINLYDAVGPNLVFRRTLLTEATNWTEGRHLLLGVYDRTEATNPAIGITIFKRDLATPVALEAVDLLSLMEPY